MHKLLREMEEGIHWDSLAKLVQMQLLCVRRLVPGKVRGFFPTCTLTLHRLKKLLATPGGALLKEVSATVVDDDGEVLSARLLKARYLPTPMACVSWIHDPKVGPA